MSNSKNNDDIITNDIKRLPKNTTRTGDTNERQVLRAIHRHNQFNIPLLNRKERHIVQQHTIDELSQGFEHRKQALAMALETRLHSIREACNHVLVTGKTHLRQQRIDYFGDMYKKVEGKMNRLADTFLEEMDQRFTRMENYKSEVIRRREQQRLEKSTNDFLNTLDLLMDEFRSIINENIEHKNTSQSVHQSPFQSAEAEPHYAETSEHDIVSQMADDFMDVANHTTNKDYA